MADIERPGGGRLELPDFAWHLYQPRSGERRGYLAAKREWEIRPVFVLWAADANADEPLAFDLGSPRREHGINSRDGYDRYERRQDRRDRRDWRRDRRDDRQYDRDYRYERRW